MNCRKEAYIFNWRRRVSCSDAAVFPFHTLRPLFSFNLLRFCCCWTSRQFSYQRIISVYWDEMVLTPRFCLLSANHRRVCGCMRGGDSSSIMWPQDGNTSVSVADEMSMHWDNSGPKYKPPPPHPYRRCGSPPGTVKLRLSEGSSE